MTEALRSRYRSIHAGERLAFRTVVFRPRPAEGVLRRNGARFRDRSASMTGGSRCFRRARSFAASGPIRKQGREIQRYYLFGTLRGEACGERHRRASAGGGFGPRGAPWRRSVAASRSFVLASPKILRLDNVQINLTLSSLNRTLADAEDTPPRQLQINLHCARLNRIFAPLWRRDYTKNKRYTTLQRSPN